MEDRAVTNILLAIIAGCLLFGGAATLSGLKTFGIVAVVVVVAIIALVIFIRVLGAVAFPVLEWFVDDVSRASTPLSKSAVIIGNLFAIYLVLCAIAAVVLSADHDWAFKAGIRDMLASGWGFLLAIWAVAIGTWFAGRFVGRLLKRLFNSPGAAYRIDMLGTASASFVLLPLFMAFRASANGKGAEAINEFFVGIAIWAVIFLGGVIVVATTMVMLDKYGLLH